MAFGKFLRLTEAVLGAKADDLNLICMFSSELLDFGGFPSANRSMWCPHPHQHRLL